MNRFALTGARVWTGDGGAFDGHVIVSNGIIERVAQGACGEALPRVDLSGYSLSPGMIDLMVMGGFDRSILRDDPLDIAKEYLRLGVTSCQFCIGTLPWDSMVKVATNIRRALSCRECDSARVLGVYCEGPFQQPHLTGASLRDFALEPSPETVERLLADMGNAITMVNVAPGLPGDAEAVSHLVASGKIVSMAHSDAPAERVFRCVEAGTTVLGHAWDNNSGRIGDSGVQQPTIEHVAMTDERIRYLHVIADGVHVHPVMLRLLLRARGSGALCLVTDAVTRAGMPDGPYVWDDGRRFFKSGGVGRTDTGWLCGSATLLPDMFRNYVNFTGLPPQEAIRAVTGNPAASLGMSDEIGHIAAGRIADLVAWDSHLRVRRVWRQGVEISHVSSYGEVEISP